MCVRSYLISVVRYKFLILDTYHPHTIFYLSKDVRIRGYFSKPKGIGEQKKSAKHWSRLMKDTATGRWETES